MQREQSKAIIIFMMFAMDLQQDQSAIKRLIQIRPCRDLHKQAKNILLLEFLLLT